MKTSRKGLSIVKDGFVSDTNNGPTDLNLKVGTYEWFNWLKNLTSFAYEDTAGTFTARKELAKSGQGYWKAYRKKKNKLYQYYLGKSEDLTLQRLQQAAEELANRGEFSANQLKEESEAASFVE